MNLFFDLFMGRKTSRGGCKSLKLGGDCGAVGMLFDGGCGPDQEVYGPQNGVPRLAAAHPTGIPHQCHIAYLGEYNSFSLYLFIQYVLSRMRVKPQARLGSFHRCYFQNIIRIAAVRQEGTSVRQICRKTIPNQIFRIWLYDLRMKVLLNVHGSLPSETAADQILCRCNVCRPAPCGYGL